MNSNEPHLKKVDIDSPDAILSVVEEELRVTKRDALTGRVRVRTITDTVEELVRQELQGEAFEVNRVPIDTLVEPGLLPPQIRREGDVTIVAVLEEVLVVEKRLRIKEELHITRRITTEVTQTPVALHKQRAVVERLNSEGELIPQPNGEVTMTQQTITALFDKRAEATQAIGELVRAGIPRASTKLMPETDLTSASTTSTRTSYDAARDEKGFWATLGDFFMPDEDRYTYAEAMHRGSIMVSNKVVFHGRAGGSPHARHNRAVEIKGRHNAAAQRFLRNRRVSLALVLKGGAYRD